MKNLMRSLIAAASFVIAGTTAGSVLAADPLVGADWLKARLGDENIAIIEIRGGSTSVFAGAHIPGAVDSDYGNAGWRTTADGVPGMLPEPAALERLVGSLGVDNDDHVIVVPAGENASDFSAATRVYWTFKVLGHDEISVLNGGRAGWAADVSNPIEIGVSAVEPATFVAEFRSELLVTEEEEVEQALADGDTLLIDGRPSVQYRGEEKHPQARIAGTLPTAVNLENGWLVEDGGQFIAAADLAKLMNELGIGNEGEQIAFCNTGHWASIGWFAGSEIAGNRSVRLYDGSMVQLTADPSHPVANAPVE